MDDEGLTMGNVKPAPFYLTPALVGKLTGARPAYGKGVVHVPLEGRLVDGPRASAKEPRDAS